MYNPPASVYYPVDQLARWYPGIFGYWQYFCSPEAEKEIQANVRLECLTAEPGFESG